MKQLSVVRDELFDEEKTHQHAEDESTEDSEDTSVRQLSWDEGDPAATNYRKLGSLLARSGDLFGRSGYEAGLILVRPDGSTKLITTAADLAPVIVDRVALTIYLDGKPKGSKLSAAHMNAMLRTKAFLSKFAVVDHISTVPRYLPPNFSLTEPGYNDGGEDHRYFFVGESPQVFDSMDRIERFLDVMDLETEADRANALAAGLTVLLRNHWPGGKPIVLLTASKSHAGKDTVIAFASGETEQCSISYQGTDWALERSLVGALNHNADCGVLVVENARLDRRGNSISSAIIERFATDPNVFLFSTGTGPATRRRNDIVLAISTNFGTVSEDILNRCLPIHLDPVGNVSDRASPIGNPKLEFLPQNRDGIAAELRGMIERWKDAGCPLDKDTRHPFSEWAAVVGGILKANGIRGFLANYGKRRVADDPVRAAIGLIGTSIHGEEWYKPEVWAREVARLGLVKQVIPIGDQESFESRKRGLGVVLSAHRNEAFHVETESERLTLRLEKSRKRHDGEPPHVRYRFVVVSREAIPTDD
ncbi:hypothetical protein [Fuerstiella marisgermanici]|uniref:SF3 helicase domain-containing protein n=1 Tax=Fuerstiella marisgermanici TaxID=1891926 RepID=A0A1P8W911_9PLAN|nr:hypothetical protein [Fuerstiella marisgermanici]APZ90545.1 hypothetical protein Fuma_00124 [Fuerstiella marisgermanici]